MVKAGKSNTPQRHRLARLRQGGVIRVRKIEQIVFQRHTMFSGINTTSTIGRREGVPLN